MVQLETAITENTFVKLSLGNYQGADDSLKNIYIKRIVLKSGEKLSFTYRHKTRDLFKNYTLEEGTGLISVLLRADFKIATLFTTNEEIIFEAGLKGKNAVIRKRELPVRLQPDARHDREKKRLIRPEGNPYLQALKITDASGHVFKHAQDKYKQLNRYIEILNPLIKEWPEGTIRHVVDMGSGKGYLTFALYDHLRQLYSETEVTGVEYRQDLVSLCNTIAAQSGFTKLHFEQGTIESYPLRPINLLIALHACDTATDDAIAKGIKAGAELIVVAPCCHKQIRREIEKNKVENEVSFLTRYGIFMERQAEMVTDGIRALILEYFGYRTKVFEFISDQHTPKNVLIVGIKHKGQEPGRKETLLMKLKTIKTNFGIGYHHLEKLLDLL